jgi:phosphoadenosine phosphosulfate reductase
MSSLPALQLENLQRELEQYAALDIVRWCYAMFAPATIALSTSFGAEGMVLLDLIAQVCKTPRVFTIDTGRMFPETYDVWQRVIERYGIAIDVFYPDAQDIHTMVKDEGPNLFYKSVAHRKRCCYVRKVAPLHHALQDTQLWLTALRREQSEARADTPIIDYVPAYGLYKVCPLYNWSEETVWEYLRNNNVPYNELYTRGFRTIGCQPCSRPIGPHEELRAGRWWWEEATSKECGIHIHDGKIERVTRPPTYQI